MAMRKKGIAFALTALLMVIAISFSTAYISTRYTEQATNNVQRLVSLQTFVENVDQDLDTAIYTTTFRSLVAMQEYMSMEGEYIDDASLRMQELIINGTLLSHTSPFMINNTLPKWMADINLKAREIGLIITLDVTDISIYHQDPWSIYVDVTYDLDIEDTRGVATYSSTNIRTTVIDITGFTDPISIVETNNLVVANFEPTPYVGQFPSQITSHIEEGYFMAWPGGPSYLMRLEGNKGPSPYGVERLVDKFALAEEFVIDTESSSSDYVYWSTQQPGFKFTIGPLFFALDNVTVDGSNHIALYNLTSYVIS